MQICDIRLSTNDIGFAYDIFSSKILMKKLPVAIATGSFYSSTCPSGIYHIALAIYHISPREIYHFPARENITGGCDNPLSQLPFGGFL